MRNQAIPAALHQSSAAFGSRRVSAQRIANDWFFVDHSACTRSNRVIIRCDARPDRPSSQLHRHEGEKGEIA
ncbi:hypothetical protein [Rhodopseudomonas palustris]|uniref:hypothetical protein n=1 Tax=Rhodopseudomonas palustris TaxID=1076 RepID=UPI001057A772|nr:hypothetical protein [Rhodopseudomonas palustris]